jgi:hypothetical protein
MSEDSRVYDISIAWLHVHLGKCPFVSYRLSLCFHLPPKMPSRPFHFVFMPNFGGASNHHHPLR